MYNYSLGFLDFSMGGNMKIILKGRVTAINADKTPSIEITHARINDLNHSWKLNEELFIEIDVELLDIILPSEIEKQHKEDLRKLK